ncbi:MAG TPA: hypothetical protein ENF38_00560 [Candidatus Aenigmarchaeota archaeon]|nr:hypothetical protein [Candidatus Aenigmarchaeota archaeon]
MRLCSNCGKGKPIEAILIMDKEYYFCSRGCLINFLLKREEAQKGLHERIIKVIEKEVKEETRKFLQEYTKEINKEIVRKIIFDKEIINELCEILEKR